MRINRLFAFRKWVPTARAMGPMIRELYQHPEKGLLGHELFVYWRGPVLLQYWRSFEDLERFARDPESSHLPAWKRFNQLARGSGDVGIWHETYRVRAGEYEAIYGNMPRVGLGAAGEHGPLGSTSTASLRAGVRAEDAAPVAGY